MKNNIQQFIQRVESVEHLNQNTITVQMELLIAAKDALKTLQQARANGGRNSRLKAELKTDPQAIKNREKTRKYRAKKRAELTK